MATLEQKEHLMQTLRFTPRNITISLSGYGGEIVMGTVDPAVARYWQARDDFEQYASSWSMEEEFSDVPDQYRFIDNGAFYEVNDLAHCSGVEMSSGCWLRVEDTETGQDLLCIELDPEVLAAAGIEAKELESVEVETDVDRAVFVGQNFEKGTFFQTEVEITEAFDPTQLAFEYGTYDGWRVCNSVCYKGQELDGQDAYDTVGKSSNFELYVADDVEILEGEETWAQQAIDEGDLGPWHDTADHDPVHVGYYDCRLVSTHAAEQRLQWNGSDWIMANGDPTRLHVSQWRGLNHPVDQ